MMYVRRFVMLSVAEASFSYHRGKMSFKTASENWLDLGEDYEIEVDI